MEILQEYIGFYEWEGLPCQVKSVEDEPDAMEALAYIAGEGFTHVSLSEVLLDGLAIPEKQFKQMVMELASRQRKNR